MPGSIRPAPIAILAGTNGTLLANLLAVATALGLPAKVVCGFVDATVNRLLDVDSQREVAFSLVALGHDSRPSSPTAPQVLADISPLGLETVPLSRDEIDYPIMREMHAASSLDSPKRLQRGEDLLCGIALRHWALRRPPDPWFNFTFRSSPYPTPKCLAIPIEQVILRRGSSRQFARTPISLTQLSTMLDRTTRGIPADFLTPFGSQLNHLYLIVHAVEGLESGAYVFHRDRGVLEHGALECLKQGNFRNEAGYLGLEQQLPADAAVDIFFMADLRPIFDRFGNRGYRAVQLEAGILGGKLYLAAYASSSEQPASPFTTTM